MCVFPPLLLKASSMLSITCSSSGSLFTFPPFDSDCLKEKKKKKKHGGGGGGGGWRGVCVCGDCNF